MNKEKTNKNPMHRRDFLIRLGSGLAASVITGYFVFEMTKTADNDNQNNFLDGDHSNNHSNKPKLSNLIKMVSENNSLVLYGENVTCSVNKTGEKIIQLLDGKHTLYQISSKISEFYSIEYTDDIEVSIAYFICQLGSLGFLSSPFYVTIYEA